MFSRSFVLKIVAEGFRDKIFGTGVVAALVHALSDKDSNVRRSAVDFFTATIAEGTLSCFFHGISFALK